MRGELQIPGEDDGLDKVTTASHGHIQMHFNMYSAYMDAIVRLFSLVNVSLSQNICTHICGRTHSRTHTHTHTHTHTWVSLVHVTLVALLLDGIDLAHLVLPHRLTVDVARVVLGLVILPHVQIHSIK
jgi:hypothetical protein